MTTNPSHILIARNSRGPNNPSAALSSPTETHAAAAGIFRSTAASGPSSSGSPPWLLEECETDELVEELSLYEEEPIELNPTFTREGRFPGTVKIVVESTTFWAHKEILYFASPFFEAALSGCWLETGRPPSMSSVITISQPPSVPERSTRPSSAVFTSDDAENDTSPDADNADDSDLSDVPEDQPKMANDAPGPNRSQDSSDASASGTSEDEVQTRDARSDSLAKLQGASGSLDSRSTSTSTPVTLARPNSPESSNEGVKSTKISKGTQAQGKFKSREDDQVSARRAAQPARAAVRKRHRADKEGQDAIIVLKEERAVTFHDFLKFVYPHLECTITWNNVEGLMNISHKLLVPALQSACLNFLLTHAAGRPIKAMRIAELFEEEELYREASRFVLDNPGGWSEEELSTLSCETLLKLEKRRNWFLERVLKLGMVPLAKEYQCCSTCPDTANCARLLEEKWRQAYNAVFRFGPCQPSMVYRYLRNLEGVSPPLSLTHLACQTTAKAFIATLFDRMFSLGVRGEPNVTATALGARAAAVAAAASGPRRHFLFCALKPEKPVTRPRRSREQTA